MTRLVFVHPVVAGGELFGGKVREAIAVIEIDRRDETETTTGSGRSKKDEMVSAYQLLAPERKQPL